MSEKETRIQATYDALHVMPEVGFTEFRTSAWLADKIKAGAVSIPFTTKAIYDKGWHGLKDRQEVEAACNILIDENWLKIACKPATGNRSRPPSPDYYINPVFL